MSTYPKDAFINVFYQLGYMLAIPLCDCIKEDEDYYIPDLEFVVRYLCYDTSSNTLDKVATVMQVLKGLELIFTNM